MPMARFRRRKRSRRLCAAKAAARAQNVRFHSYVSERDRAELAAIIGSCSERILERLALQAGSASTPHPAPPPPAADARRDRRDEAALEREFDRFVSAAATALAGRSIGVT